MALGVANAQTVLPAMTNTVLPPVMNTTIPLVTSQCNNIKTVTLTSTPYVVQSAASSDEPPSTTVTSLNNVDTTQIANINSIDPAQSGNMHQKLMEHLANSVTKNGNAQESDCNNEELIEFMRLVDQFYVIQSINQSITNFKRRYCLPRRLQGCCHTIDAMFKIINV